jgi:peptidoglycan/LPS O-acetylase OafA/YrhL
MPEPVDRGHRYVRGLDGLRAIAVMAVIAFHLGFSWAPGGLLGVAVFFTLSGYLITDLLMGQFDRDGRLHMQQFWIRRARRLLPAVGVLLLAVLLWVSVDRHSQLGPLWGNTWAAAGYYSNWWLIFHHVSYFARFGPPSPLGHLWSLAVEEQFYLIWPWLLLVATRYIRTRRVLSYLALVAAALSAIEMAVLWHPGVDPTRVYDGTDTRAFGLLIGAALAFVWPSRPSKQLVARIPRLAMELVGLAGLAVIIVMVATVGQYSPFLYRGGLVILSVATAAVVAALVYPRALFGRVIGMRPMQWVGVRSYGIYLWHYPIIVLTTPLLARPNLTRSFFQIAATFAVAAMSWRLVEDPIRSGTWRRPRLPARQPGRLKTSPALVLSTVGVAVVSLVVVTAIDRSSTVRTAASELPNPTQSAITPAPPAAPRPTASQVTTVRENLNGRPVVYVHPGRSPAAAQPAAPKPAATLAAAPKSSCRAVVHLGDSTSESLISSNYLPDPAQRLDAQYRRVGVTQTNLQISGARSMWEHFDGEPNGLEVAQKLVSQGYRGCWVVALGTNDAANLAVGSNVSEATRIKKMMSAIGNEPVMWVNTISLVPSGPYSASNMARWDKGLEQACHSYPNMRILNWSALAQPSWFISDGIHYSTPGSAQRAALIATRLAKAFPNSGSSSGCLVQ